MATLSQVKIPFTLWTKVCKFTARIQTKSSVIELMEMALTKWLLQKQSKCKTFSMIRILSIFDLQFCVGRKSNRSPGIGFRTTFHAWSRAPEGEFGKTDNWTCWNWKRWGPKGILVMDVSLYDCGLFLIILDLFIKELAKKSSKLWRIENGHPKIRNRVVLFFGCFDTP